MLKTPRWSRVIALPGPAVRAPSHLRRNFQMIPLLIVAELLVPDRHLGASVGQYYLERHFGQRATRRARGAVQRLRVRCDAGSRRERTRATRPADITQPMVEAPRACTSPSGTVEVLKGIDMTVARRRGRSACSGRPARASPPSCAASTTSRRSTAAACRSTASWSATGERGDKLHELKRDARSPPARREIGMVFQRFNLFPHMTALENIMEAPVAGAAASRKAEAARRGARAARAGRAWPTKADALPAAALRRPAAAGGHRPGAGHAARS